MSDLIPARQIVQDVWRGRSSGLALGPILSTVKAGSLKMLADELASAMPPSTNCSFGSAEKDTIRQSATNFHDRAGTLTSAVRNNISRLFDVHSIRVAHTPDMLPYYSVAMLPLVANQLARLVSQRVNSEVLEVYVAVDTDLATDRRVRTAVIPDVFRRGGELPLGVLTPRSERKRIIAAQRAPTLSEVTIWREFYLQSAARHLKFLGSRSRAKALEKIAYNVCGLFEDMSFAASTANDLAEFSNIVFSRLVNIKMGLPTVFLSQLDVCRALTSQFLAMHDEAANWQALSAEAVREFERRGVRVGSAAVGSGFWLVCSGCGRRQPALANQSRIACDCGRDAAGRIMVPTVWVDNIVDVKVMGFVAGASYVGSSGHVAVSAEVHAQLGISYYHELLFSALGAIWGPPEITARSLQADSSAASHFSDSVANVLARAAEGRTSFIYPISCHGLPQVISGWREHILRHRIGTPYEHPRTWLDEA